MNDHHFGEIWINRYSNYEAWLCLRFNNHYMDLTPQDGQIQDGLTEIWEDCWMFIQCHEEWV